MKRFLLLPTLIVLSALASAWAENTNTVSLLNYTDEQLDHMVRKNDAGTVFENGFMPINDDTIARIVDRHPDIQSVQIGRSPPITVKSLQSLAKLKNLRGLALSGRNITDKDLAVLASMTSLHSLKLSGCAVDGSGLSHLEKLPHLAHINLESTQLSDGGLAGLKDMPHLKSLRLGFRPITGQGLANMNIGNHTNLNHLSLWYTSITDEDLHLLKPLKNVTFLSLEKTNITDAGMPRLAELTNLTHLDLYETGVTTNGLAMLKKALPGLDATINAR